MARARPLGLALALCLLGRGLAIVIREDDETDNPFAQFLDQVRATMPGLMDGSMNSWMRMGDMMGAPGMMKMSPVGMSDGRKLLAQKELSAGMDSMAGVLNAAWKFGERTMKISAMWPMALSALPMMTSAADRWTQQFAQWGQNAQRSLAAAVQQSEANREASSQKVLQQIHSMSDNVLHQFDNFQKQATAQNVGLGPMLMVSKAVLPKIPGMKPMADMLDQFQSGNVFNVATPGKGMDSLRDWLFKIQAQLIRTSTEQAKQVMTNMLKTSGQIQTGDPAQVARMQDSLRLMVQSTSDILDETSNLMIATGEKVNANMQEAFPGGEFKPTIAHLRSRLTSTQQTANDFNQALFEIGAKARKQMVSQLAANGQLAVDMMSKGGQGSQAQAQVDRIRQGVTVMSTLMEHMEEHQTQLARRLLKVASEAAMSTASVLSGSAEAMQEATKILDEMKEVIADVAAAEKALTGIQELHRKSMNVVAPDEAEYMKKLMEDVRGFTSNMNAFVGMQGGMTNLYNQMQKAMDAANQMNARLLAATNDGIKSMIKGEDDAMAQIIRGNQNLEGQREFFMNMANNMKQAISKFQPGMIPGMNAGQFQQLQQSLLNNMQQAMNTMTQVSSALASSTHKVTENAGLQWHAA